MTALLANSSTCQKPVLVTSTLVFWIDMIYTGSPTSLCIHADIADAIQVCIIAGYMYVQQTGDIARFQIAVVFSRGAPRSRNGEWLRQKWKWYAAIFAWHAKSRIPI